MYQNDLSSQAHSNDFYRDYSARFTWQAAEKHKIVLASSFQHNCNCVYALFIPQTNNVLIMPTAATEHNYEPNFVSSLSWTSPATNKLLFTATAGVAWVNQIDYRGPDVTEQSIQVTDTGLGIKYGASYGATAGGSIPRNPARSSCAVHGETRVVRRSSAIYRTRDCRLVSLCAAMTTR